MKKKLTLLTLLSLLSISLSACAPGTHKDDNNKDEPSSPSEPSTPDDPITPVDPDDPDDPVDPVDPETITIQDETILHAFNWSISNVHNNLDNIKNAGFHTVQLSPMQPQKDPYDGYWKDQWWKLYQPYGFKVATGGENRLGTKEQLTSLCSAAKAKGINIITDVVTNHLAGPNNGDKKNNLNSSVQGFESDIYNNKLIHTIKKDANDNDLQSIVQGNIGDYPDLMTEDSRVQNRVISMLKEYIDCGIAGFRFDAAKHIETPDDGTYASNYWPNVINAVTNYAINKGKDKPYVYGEILYQCGKGRSYSSYTKYMSVVDSSQGTAILNAVKSNNVNNISTTYNSGVNADHLVLWAESHDTYSNDGQETTNVPANTINKAYMVQASRKDASSLYLARPGGNLGYIGSEDYKKASISAINKFHTMYAKQNESISKNNGVFINIRGNQNKGAALININDDNTSKTVSINLANGKYTDMITNKSYTVNNGSITVSFTDGACILIPDGTSTDIPVISANPKNKAFQNNVHIEISASGATSSYYQINGGEKVSFTTNTTIDSSSFSKGGIKLSVVSSNSAGTAKETYYYAKTSLYNKSVVVTNIPDLNSYSYLAWNWPDGQNGHWVDVEIDNNMIGFNLTNNNYLLVKFDKGTTSSSANWDNARAQTADFVLGDQVIDYQTL